MTVSSADFLVSAATYHVGGSEVDLRNCISRAYYSMYHAALPVADAHFPDLNPVRGIGTHQRLSNRFTNLVDRAAKSAGYVLENAKRARHRADYDLNDTVDAADAVQALATARAFPGQLARCFPPQAASNTGQSTGTP